MTPQEARELRNILNNGETAKDKLKAIKEYINKLYPNNIYQVPKGINTTV